MELPNIISKQGEQVIRNFKYKGGSISYSYNALWSPLAQYLLNYVPLWWAPNAITLLGLLINLFGCILIISQSSLGQLINPFTLPIYSLCVFTYQTLDNIDGKQARKTGNSSPLGMLFDHGCDAFGLIFLCLSVARIVCIGDERTVLYVGFVGVMFGFYFSVWCQYHSKGIMILGEVNAVDDGIPAVAIIGMFTFFVGQQWWKTPFTQIGTIDIMPGYCVAYGILFSSILQIWSLLNHSKSNFTKDWMGAIQKLTHVVLILISLITIIECSQLHIHHFYTIFFSLCLMFVRNIIYMQICVTAQMPYNQYQLSTVLFIVGYPLYIFVFSKWGWDETLYVYAILAVIIVDFVQLTLRIIFEIRKILNIRVFRVSKIKK